MNRTYLWFGIVRWIKLVRLENIMEHAKARLQHRQQRGIFARWTMYVDMTYHERQKVGRIIIHTIRNYLLFSWRRWHTFIHGHVVTQLTSAEQASIELQCAKIVKANKARRDLAVQRAAKLCVRIIEVTLVAWKRFVKETKESKRQKEARRDFMLSRIMAQAEDLNRRVFVAWKAVLFARLREVQRQRLQVDRLKTRLDRTKKSRIFDSWSTVVTILLHEKHMMAKVVSQVVALALYYCV